MAENKKSFVLYCDLLHTVGHLTDEQAGKLFKHILNYVNDKDPHTDDVIINLAFEPIKQQLKRDLKKWVGYIKKQRENGKKGGRPPVIEETQKTQAFFEKPKKADNVSVTVNDNVSVNDNVIVMRGRDTRTVVNAETEILKNPIDFERIVMNAGREKSQGFEILHTYHLYLESKELYPKTKKSVFAGFEKWINDEKKFERNGTHKRNNSNGGEKLGTSEARIDKASKWGS